VASNTEVVTIRLPEGTLAALSLISPGEKTAVVLRRAVAGFIATGGELAANVAAAPGSAGHENQAAAALNPLKSLAAASDPKAAADMTQISNDPHTQE